MKGNHALFAQIRQRDDELTRLRASLAAAEAKLADAEKHADELAAGYTAHGPCPMCAVHHEAHHDYCIVARHAARRAARDGQEGTR